LHCDWGGQGQAGVWYLCHAICALVDFNTESGATRVIPGSHKNPRMVNSRHNLRMPHPKEVYLKGEAGTIFILNVHCLHSAVENRSQQPRLALFSSFSRTDSLLLAINPHIPPSEIALMRFDPEVRRILTGAA
jgi:ectoine hydroxylase-related dioxygenase (phytanoyl-CoA dioxygenase family)